MKAKMYCVTGFVFCLLFLAGFGQASENLSAPGPEAFFPQARFEFAPVVEGVEVQHAFSVQNRGMEPLKILNVRTG